MVELGFRNFLCMLMMMTAMSAVTRARLHYVGGNKMAWAPNVDLADWSRKENFAVGDWLYFGFDKHLYNVLEVNKTSYENCIDTGFIKNITRGGRDVYQLTESKPYYFLSGRGYCFNGLKVAVNVEDIIKPSPPPKPEENTGFSLNSAVQIKTRLTYVLLLAAVRRFFCQLY